MLVPQSCPTLWDPMDCSLPGSSVHRTSQARILEWVASSFSRNYKGVTKFLTRMKAIKQLVLLRGRGWGEKKQFLVAFPECLDLVILKAKTPTLGVYSLICLSCLSQFEWCFLSLAG